MAEVLDKYKINGVSYTCVGFKKDGRVAILFDGKRNRDFDVEKGHFVGETKVCEDCKKDLPLDKFSIVRGGKLRNQCRECFGIRVSKGHARARIDSKKKTKETVETPVNVEPEKEKVTLSNKEIYEAEMTRHQEKVKAIAKREEKETKETTKVEEDMVNHPNHYQGLEGLEVITVMRNYLPKYEDGYVAGMVKDVIKYILRAPSKGNLVQDLKKAQKYLNFAIDYLEGKQND